MTAADWFLINNSLQNFLSSIVFLTEDFLSRWFKASEDSQNTLKR